jgi:hypothetical protein
VGLESVIGTFQATEEDAGAPATYTVNRAVRGVIVNGRYVLPQPWAPLTVYPLDTIITNAGNSWEATTQGTSAAAAAAWATSTGYALNAIVQNGGSLFIAIVGGTSASSGGGPSGTGSDIDDGTVQWAFVAVAIGGPTGVGPTVADGSVVWTFLQANQLQIVASIRPVGDGRKLESESVGEYGWEDRYVYTLTQLRTRAPGNPDTEADIIVIPSVEGILESWEITEVKKGRRFYRARAQRVALP